MFYCPRWCLLVLVLVGACVLCVVCVCCGCSKFFGPLLGTPVRRTALPVDRPKFRSFFLSPTENLILSSLSHCVSSRGILCTFGLGLSGAPTAPKLAGGFHTMAREPKPAFTKTTKREDFTERDKKTKYGKERETKARNFGRSDGQSGCGSVQPGPPKSVIQAMAQIGQAKAGGQSGKMCWSKLTNNRKSKTVRSNNRKHKQQPHKQASCTNSSTHSTKQQQQAQTGKTAGTTP